MCVLLGVYTISLGAISNSSASNDPVVAVVIMVKNEEHVMRTTLEPLVQGGIDALVVFDTGSTDNTVQVTQELFDEWGIVHGYIGQEEFVDFATSRNAALDFAHTVMPNLGFVLMIDAEWFLHNPEELLAFCHQKIQQEHDTDTYALRVKNNSIFYYSPRLMRAHKGVHYQGPVHEYVVGKKQGTVPEHIYFERRTTAVGAEKSRKRWERDKEILLREHTKNPEDPRTVFYLGQTYDCLGELEQAYYWYGVRADMPGWQEENFMAAYRQAQVAEYMSDKNLCAWSHAQELYLKAFEMRPTRAEPLIRIAQYYLKKGRHQLAYIFTLRALKIAYPADTLFVDKNLYEFDIHDIMGQIGWYVGEYQEGQKEVLKALQARPGTQHLLKNLELYHKKLEGSAYVK